MRPRRLAAAALIALTLTACGGSSTPVKQAIIGTWEDVDVKQLSTFTPDGKRVNGTFAPACWTIENNDTLVQTSKAGEAVRYGVTIDGDTMKIKAPLATRTLKRIDADATLTADEQAKVADLICAAP